jgi:hypothetical protein
MGLIFTSYGRFISLTELKRADAECVLPILGVRMTKYTLLLALGVSAFSAPAFAQHGGYIGQTPSNDPCVLGTNAQPGACVGPVRVAPVIVSQGSVSQSSTQVQHQQTYSAATAYRAPQPVYGVTTIAQYQAPVATQYVEQVRYVAPTPMPAPVAVSGGCVPNYPAAMQGCTGNWVYSSANTNMVNTGPVAYNQGGYNQGGFVPNGYSQGYVNTPQYAPTQAPVVYQQAPVVYQQAPVVYQQAPVQYSPQPQPVGYIPTSFFTGGITYGAGFPEGGGYSYGGGGAVIISGGGTRFSGVRERSPTPLIAPPMRRNQPRHAPPPKHCGHC